MCVGAAVARVGHSRPDAARGLAGPAVVHARMSDGGWLESAVADAVQDGLVVIDAEERIGRVNSAFCELTGFGAFELLGRRPPYPFWPESEHKRARRRLHEAEDAGARAFEVTLRRSDGALLDVTMSLAPARDSSGHLIAYVATYKDISAAQLQARFESALLRVAGLVASEAVPATVLQQVCSEIGELLSVLMVSVVRFDRPDWATRVASIGMPKDLPRRGSLADQSATAVRVADTARLARNDDMTHEDGPLARSLAAAGARYSVSVPITINGEVWGALNTFSDRPGALRAYEERLLGRFAKAASLAVAAAGAREELHLRSELLDLAHDAVLVRDPDESRVTFWNREAENIYGYSAAEALGQVTHALLATVFPKSRRAVNAALARDGQWQGELRHTRKDGTVIVVSSRQALRRDADGHPTAIIELNSDISELVFQARLERALGEVALASAGGEYDAPALFDLVAGHIAGLLDCSDSRVVRFDGDTRTVIGRHGDVGTPDPRGRLGASSLAAATGRPARVDDYAEMEGDFAKSMVAAGVRCAVAVPVSAGGRLWGTLGAGSQQRCGLPAGTERLLARFAEIVSVSLANADAELARSEEERRRILAIMLKAEQSERTRIATELHDDTVQVMAASLVELDRLVPAAASGDSERLAIAVRRTRHTLAQATERTRRLMFELRPTILHDYGLFAAARVLLEQIALETQAHTRLLGEIGRYDLVLEETVYRGMQEALSNIRKHAQASEVTIGFNERDDMLVCEVIDNGRGFDMREARARPQSELHIGLASIVERIRAAAGEVVIVSAPGDGTHIHITVPIERPRNIPDAAATG
jgi:PAS domain S-box-containing protein